MSVILVPFWKGLVFTFGAALSSRTPDRPCSSLPVTTRRIGLIASSIVVSVTKLGARFLERMKVWRAGRGPRLVGDRVQVADGVDHDRLVNGDRLRDRGVELARVFDTHSDASEGFRHLGEIDLGKAPHLLGAAALLAAIGDVVETDFLVERTVIVD